MVMMMMLMMMIGNGNRTEWSPIRSVIITSNKQNRINGARVQFIFISNYYRHNWTTGNPIRNVLQKLQFPKMKE